MSTVAETLIRAWLGDNSVQRVPNDDDEITPTARMRPMTPLTIACAKALQGFGYVQPVGDGSYLVRWRES